jgi:hypothetical protein
MRTGEYDEVAGVMTTLSTLKTQNSKLKTQDSPLNSSLTTHNS